MKHHAFLAVAALLAVPTVGRAQQMQPEMSAAGPLAAALQATLRRESRNMVAAAEAMPADKLDYKPTPEQMTFGQILAHEAQSNEMLCGALAGGGQSPAESSDHAGASKDELVAQLRKSFESCGSAIAGLSESALGDSVPFFGGRKVTKARAAIALAQDWADHYAQSAMYLRLNGILPPTARRGM
jgi:hypothetical protein